MDQITIYRLVDGAEIEVATLHPDQSCTQQKQLMGDNVLTLNFELNEEAGFQYGDYCTVFSERYKLNRPAQPQKLATNKFQYSLRMEAEYFDLSKAQYLFLGSDNSLKESDFTLMANAKGFIDLLLQNALRVSPGWKKGDVQSTIYKNLSFSKENCLSALQRLSEEFGLEWSVEGKIIHLSRRRMISKLRFRQGRNKGAYSITKKALDGSVFATRLYVEGSTRNLPVGYRGGVSRLRLPGGDPYVEANTDQGLVENSFIFEDIYPHRKGKVTALGSDKYTFFDIGINFDLNQYTLPGVEAKLTFNTGQLAGYTLKIKTFNGNTKEIVILPNTEEKAVEIPSDLLKPEVGDTYVFHDISMPQAYVSEAEKELKKAATKLINKISQPQYSYTIDFDPYYFKRRNLVLQVGMEVTIQDEELGVDQQIGIVSCTRNLKDEYKFQVEVAEGNAKGTLAAIQSGLVSNSRDISNIKNTYNTIQDNKVVGDLKINKGSIVFTELPVVDGDRTQYAQLFIHRQTGKVHREA